MARTRTQHYRLLAICAVAVLLALLANSAASAPATAALPLKATDAAATP